MESLTYLESNFGIDTKYSTEREGEKCVKDNCVKRSGEGRMNRTKKERKKERT